MQNEIMTVKRPLEHFSAAKIKTNPLNTWSLGDINDLKASIRLYGVVEPLCVIGPDSDGNYKLLSGERRLVSTRQICQEDGTPLEECIVPCHVIDGADMPEDIQTLYIETANLESRIDSPKEVINEHRAQVVKKLLKMCEDGEIPKNRLAQTASEYIRTSDRYARYWTTVFAKGTDELQEMVAKAEVSAQDASEIARFEEKTQNELVDRIKEGTPAKQVANEIRDNRKEEKRKNSSKKSYTMDEIERLTMEFNEPDDAKFYDDEDTYDQNNYSSFNNYSDSYREPRKENITPSEYLDKLNMIIAWCEDIKMKENPTDEEWNAIYACGDVADKFL